MDVLIVKKYLKILINKKMILSNDRLYSRKYILMNDTQHTHNFKPTKFQKELVQLVHNEPLSAIESLKKKLKGNKDKSHKIDIYCTMSASEENFISEEILNCRSPAILI